MRETTAMHLNVQWKDTKLLTPTGHRVAHVYAESPGKFIAYAGLDIVRPDGGGVAFGNIDEAKRAVELKIGIEQPPAPGDGRGE